MNPSIIRLFVKWGTMSKLKLIRRPKPTLNMVRVEDWSGNVFKVVVEVGRNEVEAWCSCIEGSAGKVRRSDIESLDSFVCDHTLQVLLGTADVRQPQDRWKMWSIAKAIRGTELEQHLNNTIQAELAMTRAMHQFTASRKRLAKFVKSHVRKGTRLAVPHTLSVGD